MSEVSSKMKREGMACGQNFGGFNSERTHGVFGI